MSFSEEYKEIDRAGTLAMGSFDDGSIHGDKVASEDIPCGIFIARTDKTDTCKKVSALDDKLLGMAIHQDHLITLGSVYKDSMMVAYVKRATYMKVSVNVEVSKGEDVYIHLASGTFTNESTGNLRVPNGVFEQGATAGGFAQISFDIL